MSGLSWLGFALGVVAVLAIFRPLVFLYSLLKTQYRRPKYACIDVAEVSPDVRAD